MIHENIAGLKCKGKIVTIEFLTEEDAQNFMAPDVQSKEEKRKLLLHKELTRSDLITFLLWLDSIDCKEEWFDTIERYGKLTQSLDEVISTAIDLLE